MVATLDNFLIRMTGPSQLRSELRRAALPLSRLLEAVNDSAARVGMRLPATVLGGDIFSLMSGRLRGLLEVAPAAETMVVNRPRLTRQRGAPTFNSREAPGALLMAGDSSVDKPVGPRFDEGQFEIETRGLEEFARAAQAGEVVRDFSTLLSDGPSRTVFPSLGGSDDEGFQFAPALSEPPARKQNGAGHSASLLERELRQYWRLSAQANRNEQRGLSQSHPAEVSSPSTGVTAPAGFNSTPRQWPDFVGRELSRKARVAAGQLPGHSSRNNSTRSAEKVEIQNVFNIEVKNGNESARGFDDLADKIAEILSEQALQHGIDVT